MCNSYKSLLFIFLFAFGNAALAQHRQYTMAEATNGITTTLAPKSIKNGSWRPGTHEFYQTVKNNGRDYYIKTSFPEGKIDTVMDMARFRVVGNFKEDAKTLPTFHWLSKNVYAFEKDDNLYTISTSNNGQAVTTSNAFTFPKGYANLSHAANGAIAYTLKNNLYYANNLPSNFSKAIAVTNDRDSNIINGQAVHRNEFGIDKGIFFSPKGTYLAYYRMDQTMVADYPIIDWSVVPAQNHNIKYPMAGRTSHQVTLQVFNPATGQTTAVKTEGPKDQYLTCITWSPDEKYLYIGILNRDQNHLWLNQYDAKTGEKTKTIIQETDDKYVEPQHPLTFLPGNNNEFLWWSQRDGYMHLWLCNIARNSMTCLTPGSYVVNDFLGFNEKKREVLFTSAKEDSREKHGYAVNWETGKMHRFDSEPGTHNYSVSEDGSFLYGVFSNESEPTGTFDANLRNNPSVELRAKPSRGDVIAKRSLIRSEDGSVVKVLEDAPNTLADFERPEIKSLSFKVGDGTTLYGRLILPVHFDTKKKYPVIVYLYNGPHVQLVKNAFPGSINLWYEYLAQHGYIVWTMDGRGSSNRGMKFEQVTFRHLGTVEMEDQLKGVEFLKTLPYVDANRMGVHGWSFGGFMTTSLMLRHPGVFKVAVAGGPVMDWSMYEVMYGERYMDKPQDNPEGYAESDLLTKAGNLKGKLLVINGAQDATVVWQHSIDFLKASVDANVQVDYFVYPGYEHNVRGKDRVHLMQKITDYFDEFLK
ncbi:MAG: DPP IV N-terminal domain-containing protein [Chitinophagaceae bacterium]